MSLISPFCYFYYFQGYICKFTFLICKPFLCIQRGYDKNLIYQIWYFRWLSASSDLLSNPSKLARSLNRLVSELGCCHSAATMVRFFRVKSSTAATPLLPPLRRRLSDSRFSGLRSQLRLSLVDRANAKPGFAFSSLIVSRSDWV